MPCALGWASPLATAPERPQQRPAPHEEPTRGVCSCGTSVRARQRSVRRARPGPGELRGWGGRATGTSRHLPARHPRCPSYRHPPAPPGTPRHLPARHPRSLNIPVRHPLSPSSPLPLPSPFPFPLVPGRCRKRGRKRAALSARIRARRARTVGAAPGPHRAGSDRTGPGRTVPSRVGPYRAGSGRTAMALALAPLEPPWPPSLAPLKVRAGPAGGRRGRALERPQRSPMARPCRPLPCSPRSRCRPWMTCCAAGSASTTSASP